MLSAIAARSSKVDYGERAKIENFCRQYRSSLALDYYTQDTFFYRVLNAILRQHRHDVVYLHRHAIFDIIQCIRRPLPSEEDSVQLSVFRGQLMTLFEIDKLKNNVGEIVAASSFFSTTLNHSVAEVFAGNDYIDDPHLVSVVIKIYLNTGQSMRPYAAIYKSGEQEVLFSPGTKFRLVSCRKLHDKGRLWYIELEAIAEQQQEQLKLTHGETFLLLSSASGWPTSVVIVPISVT